MGTRPHRRKNSCGERGEKDMLGYIQGRRGGGFRRGLSYGMEVHNISSSTANDSCQEGGAENSPRSRLTWLGFWAAKWSMAWVHEKMLIRLLVKVRMTVKEETDNSRTRIYVVYCRAQYIPHTRHYGRRARSDAAHTP